MATLDLGFLPATLAVFCGGALLYAILLVVYRLALHPLAKFPGPKMAAATGWYEFYFDILKGYGGQFAWEVDRMHDVYGPIIRINPDEIHIKDPDMYSVIHASNPTNRDKYPPAANMVGTPLASFGTIEHSVHRKRRAAINTVFSNRAITEAEPFLWEQVNKMCEVVHSSVVAREVVELHYVLIAFASDTTALYLLAKDLGLLGDKEKAREWAAMTEMVTKATPLGKQFPWIIPLGEKIPLSVVRVMNPVVAGLLSLGQRVRCEASAYMADQQRTSKPGMDMKAGRTPAIYHAIQQSSLPPSDKTVERMKQESVTLMSAGGETTARILQNAIFHLLANPEALAPLRKELSQVMPDIHATPSVKTLKELPWLTAVIKENLRISALLTSRLPLRAPNELRYKDWVIPPKTPVSDTIHDVLLNPNIFAEPKRFKPERWLESEEKTATLNRYFVPFSKGTRMCIGMQLAYSQMYMVISALFRRFELELYDTIRERDIDIVRDCFLGEPHPDSVGVRVKVVKVYS